MILTKVKQLKTIRILNRKTNSSMFEFVGRDANQKMQLFKQIKGNKQEQLNEIIHTFQVIDGVSLWEVNRRLRRLLKMNIPKNTFGKQSHKIILSKKKSNILATPLEIDRIEKTINELESIEELRLHYFYNFKPVYKEKKLFGEIERWIEINID